MQAFVADAQDKSRSALEKSLAAAHAAWEEQLKSDQAKFEAELLACLACVGALNAYQRSERESAKLRAKLVKQLED